MYFILIFCALIFCDCFQNQLEQFGASRGNVVMSDNSQDYQLVIGRQDVSVSLLIITLYYQHITQH